MFYSNTIFANVGMDPTTITALIGIVNFVSTLGGLGLLAVSGRRTIMLYMNGLMAIILVLVGLSIKNQWTTPTIICIMSFIAVFEFSSGPITWLYMSEIMQDKAVSVATVLNWLMNLVISIITPVIASEETIPYIFISVGALTTLGTIFIFFFMKETRGLNKQ